MSAIQELIVQLNKTQETEARLSLTEQIRTQVKSMEMIWAAFCPATKHYFLAKDENQMTAYLFSDKAYYDTFAEELHKKHIILNVVENKAEHRGFLFAELYRCGVTQVILDSAQEHVSVPLTELVEIPDYSGLPLVQRPVLNPAVTGKILCFMQDVQFHRADGNAELDVFQEIYHSAFLLPFRPKTGTEPEKAGIYSLPDGDRFFMIFTDLYSLKQANPEEYHKAKIVRFGDFQKLLSGNTEVLGIIINPSSGAPMLLDRQLLDIAEKYATGAVEHLDVRSLNEDSGKVIVKKPEVWPQDMADRISAVLEEETTVHAAYLRTIRRDEDIRPHFLIVLDWETEADSGTVGDIQKKISEAAMPFARGLNLEYISYQNPVGKEWAGSSGPFWEKKAAQTSTPETRTEKPEKKKGLFGGLFKK